MNRPVLKEYIFEPKTYFLKLTEGEHKQLQIKGKRVAYSCFGNIQTLNGQPEKGVIVQAFGANVSKCVKS